MVQIVPGGCEILAGFCPAMTGKLCQPCTKWVPFFEPGKDKAAKSKIPKIQWASNHYCL